MTAVALVASGALALAACSSPPSSAAPATIPASSGLPVFYSTPVTLPSYKPGTVIKYEKIPSGSVHGTVYRVMYVSTDVHGKPVAVTGLVMVPETAPPSSGYPVVTWGHGTNGMADQCAPSLSPASAVPLTNQLLAQGWEVVASDYQGEGTPGLLPYLVGEVAARNTLDIVRAARNLAVAHAGSSYVVWGHSEGGQTAMFALNIASTYAPDLHLEGVVAGAPPSQFQGIYTFLKTSPYRFYLFMAGAGFNAAYGNTAAPLSEVVTPKALTLLPVLEKGCFSYLQKTLDQYSLAQLVKADPFTVPAWRTLLSENDPANFTTPSTAPLLMIQGGNDEQIPVATTQLLEQHECSIGQGVERWVYPGFSHAGVIAPSAKDMIHWIADRFAGDPTPDPYAPTGAPGINITSCQS